MKLLFLHILIFCQLSLAIAQNNVWVPVEDPVSGVTVKMPQLPKYEQEELFTSEGVIIKEIYSTKHNGVDLFFETQPIPPDGKKANQTAINKVIKLVAIQNQGTPGKKQKLKKEDFTYYYIETPLVSGAIIRSVVFVYHNRLIHIYMKGSMNTIFDIDANFYLGSWQLPNANTTPTVETKTEMEKVSEEKVITQPFNWITVKVDDHISTKFPGKPFKKATFMERGNNDILITSYAYTDLENRLNYVVTQRVFNNDEGQLTDEDLFDYVSNRVVESKKLKQIKAIDSAYGQQYVFSKGIRFYRLNLLRIDNTLYQFLVKGKRKSIFGPPAEYFFKQVKPQN